MDGQMEKKIIIIMTEKNARQKDPTIDNHGLFPCADYTQA